MGFHRVGSVSRWLLRASVVTLVLACAGCGGGGGGGTATPASPSPTTPTWLPAGGVCGVLNGATGIADSIVSGTTCSALNSPVILLNLRDQDGRASGGCSGTVIARRAVLTAAHCLLGGVSSVLVEQGNGVLVRAVSFHAISGYRESDLLSPDVGVIITAEDLSPPIVPLLLSRDARVNESAVIVGWGKDQFAVGTTLRAAATSIATVGTYFLETRVASTGSGVCSGDSGGPILLSEGGVWSVAGVTSASSTGGACIAGSNYFTNLRNAEASAFVLGLVPDAGRR